MENSNDDTQFMCSNCDDGTQTIYCLLQHNGYTNLPDYCPYVKNGAPIWKEVKKASCIVEEGEKK